MYCMLPENMNAKIAPEAFSKLKPLCVEFLKECSIKNIEKLEEVVKELDYETVDSLQEFIVLPFRAHLGRKLSEKVTIKCINFLKCIFKKSSVDSWCFFADIFILMTSKISDLQDINKVCNCSEELKLSICENILSLIQCSSEDVLNEMYSLSFRPNLAHAFYVLNLLLNHEKSKTLQRAILSTIGALAYNEVYVNKKYKKTEEIASEALASCLPGLSIVLQKVACGNVIQGHNIVLMALNILADLIVLVVGDKSYERGITKNSSSEIYCIAYKCGKQSAFLEPVLSDKIPVVIKDDTWFKTVSEKFEILITNLTVLSAHEHWKVRLEFLKFIRSIIFSCTKTLENCIPILLPSVFGLSVDNNELVSSYGEDLLVSFTEKLQSLNCSSLNSIIEDNIDKLTLQLVKCKLSANESKKLATLKTLQGYLEILGLSLNKFVFSTAHLERIILTLITLLEFDTSVSNLVEEVPTLENFSTSSSLWPKKRFKFFENEDILKTIYKICYSLGHVENSQLLVDYLLEKLSCNNLYSLQCILIIGSIVRGLAHEPGAAEKYSELISNVLEAFLSPSMFDVPIQNKDTVHLDISTETTSMDIDLPNNIFNKNKLQICLLLEAIANCSKCLGNDFKVHLMKVLCPVMEKTGSSNFIISQCGRLCLYSMAKSCNYKSVQKLINSNADYITNLIMINIHRFMYKPEVAVILRVVMEQSDADAIVLFRDLIFQILNILDRNQDKAYNFMNVLFSVVHSIKKWFPNEKNQSAAYSQSKGTIYKDLKNSVLEYLTVKKITCNLECEDFDKEIKENAEVVEDDYSEKKANVPLHVNITCEIFKRCIHLQSAENTYLRMLTLETVELCILILCDHELHLHPLVHEFWSPFLRRFLENSFISKAFDILLIIVNECADFVRYRTLKEVIPKLVQFLKNEKSKSLLKCNFRQYQWSSDHKFQILVLSEIGSLCTKLDIDGKNFNDVINVCLSYLENEQPKLLQDAALKSLNALTTHDPDAVWFYWNELYSKVKTCIPPHKSLLELSFPFSNNSITSVNIDF